jgi:hypothetical protein
VRLPALNNKEAVLSAAQLIRMRGALARALSTDDVNELGLQTGQSERLRTITPHKEQRPHAAYRRLFLSTVAGLAGGQVESIADLLRELHHQNDVTVAYKAFYNRLAHAGFANFMHQMFGPSSSGSSPTQRSSWKASRSLPAASRCAPPTSSTRS